MSIDQNDETMTESDSNVISFEEAVELIEQTDDMAKEDSDQQISELSTDTESDRSFTDEEIDAVADAAIETLQSILEHFDVGEVTIDEYEGDEGELILDVTGGDLAVLIGRHGRTLEALQYLTSAILHKKLGFRYPVVVDIESYKSRQRQKLEDIAYDAAERAVEQQRNVKLRPMTPYERRIIHIYLREDDRVSTKSEGEGHARRVVVIPN